MDAPPNILITGATDGIGLHLSRLYAEDGADVIVTGRRSLEDLPEGCIGDRVSYVQADQKEPALAAAAILSAVRLKGWCHIDVAILNAATGWSGDPVVEPQETIFRQVAVNLTAPILIARGLADLILARNGLLSVIGSVAHRGMPEFATYAATKAGLNGLVRSLDVEWRGRAHVQVLHPGPTSTAMQKKAGFDDTRVRRFFIKPERMAWAIHHAIKKRSRSREIGHLFCLRASFLSTKLAST